MTYSKENPSIMELSTGTLLQGGKYKIIEKIGQGGFGIVYKAFHESLQCNICIKEFFFSDLCERAKKSSKITIISSSAEKIQLVDSLRRKFIKEAQRLAQFQNPHIIHVMDNFEENNTAYFAMEYIEGGSLEDIIVRNGAMSEDKAKHIMLPIIDALEVVHNKGLLHLDIKPANILLRNNISAVLIDFGISKYMEMAGGHTTTAPLGLSKGYAPMEQYGGTITDFSKATDVYSICATLYKMVTGVTPPEPLQIHTNGLKTPRELNSQLSLKFSNIITKGLSFKATDRPQSMSELRNQFSITENNSDRKTTPTVVFLEPKKSISSWFLVFLLGVVIIIGSYFYDSISFKQRPLESPPLPDIVANNTDSTSTKPTSNSQNTVNEPLKEETQQNIETVSQTVEVSPTKSKSEIITGTVTDIDGNVYKTVKIGNQVWMAENLRVTHYRNGEEILNITNGQEWWYTTESAWCYYDNNPSKGLKYGILYNGFAVINEKKIAPSGWHIPTDDEWTTIIDYLGGEESAGGQMKKTGYSYWKKPNINANNKSSFSALPGGIRTSSDQNMGYVGYWWSSSTTKIAIYNSDKGIVRSPIYKAQGLSIRCIKDK